MKRVRDSARAEIRHVRIGFVYEIDIEFRRCVGVHRNLIFRQVRIYNAPDLFVRNGRFKQCRAEAEKQSADDLAAREAWIDHAPHVINAGGALDPHLSKKIDM